MSSKEWRPDAPNLRENFQRKQDALNQKNQQEQQAQLKLEKEKKDKEKHEAVTKQMQEQLERQRERNQAQLTPKPPIGHDNENMKKLAKSKKREDRIQYIKERMNKSREGFQRDFGKSRK